MSVAEITVSSDTSIGAPRLSALSGLWRNDLAMDLGTGDSTNWDLLLAGLNHLDIGFTVVDAQLRLVAANRRFQELLDYPDRLMVPGTSNADHPAYQRRPTFGRACINGINKGYFRRAIAALCAEPTAPVVAPHPARLVVVPTRAAGDTLSRTLTGFGIAVDGLPAFVTRDQIYDALHSRMPAPPARLSAFERDVMAQAAARAAAAASEDLPFRVRPGLVAELMRFYDQLRRQSQQVKRFEELIVAALGGGMFTEFRCLKVDQCLAFPAGTSARASLTLAPGPLSPLKFINKFFVRDRCLSFRVIR